MHWPTVQAADDRGAYLRTVLINLAISESRRPCRRRERPTEQVPEPTSPDTFDAALDRLDLARAMFGLTAKQRAVVVLRYLEDRPVREVAAILGVSDGTVKRQLHDAVAHLRGRLPKPGASAEPVMPTPRADQPSAGVPHV